MPETAGSRSPNLNIDQKGKDKDKEGKNSENEEASSLDRKTWKAPKVKKEKVRNTV